MLDGMTNIKASEVLKEIKYYTEDLPPYSPDEVAEALEMAIKALEQQPKPMEKFDDVKTHIQRLAGDYKCWDNRLTWEEALELNRMLEAQPNSNEFFNFDAPMVKKSDAVSREAVIENVIKCTDMNEDTMEVLENKVKALPSVTPERPKGKWIEVEVRNVYATLKCSVCGRVIEPIFDFCKYSYEDIKRSYLYCHCGAYMGGEEDG